MTQDLFTQNGHHQVGRTPPEQPTYTFANGVVATLHPVSQFTLAHVQIQARKKFAPPDAPLNEVDYGDGKKLEANYGDPDYIAEVQRYDAMINTKVMDAIIELGMDVEIDASALARVARAMDAVGTPLEEISDKVAYIKHCCMFDVESGMGDLMTAMRSLMGPREEDVADHVATFPAVVSRA
jgi:hypothetical protein